MVVGRRLRLYFSMPLDFSHNARATHRSTLAVATALVLTAHAWLLGRWPVTIHPPDSSIRFQARTMELDPSRARTEHPPATNVARQQPLPKRVSGRAPANLEDAAQAATPQPRDTVSVPTAAIETPPAPSVPDSEPQPPEAATPPSQAPAAPPRLFVTPNPTRLKYRIDGEERGMPYAARGELQWNHDGKGYEARLEISHFLLGARIQTSRGALSADGLAPTRFSDKYRSEVAAHFDWTKNQVIFSANTPSASLAAGTQDQLSTFMQLAGLFAGNPQAFAAGTLIPVETVGPRHVEPWVFKVGREEAMELPGGTVQVIQLTRDAVGDYGTRGDVWLAPSLGYLPARIRLTQHNGNVVDMKWSESLTP